MESEVKPQEFLLLFRGADWGENLSPDEMQAVMVKWMDWFNGLMADGRCKGGQPLARSGAIVSAKSDGAVADGPYVESKESIGGYFKLQVATLEEAQDIAKQCPALKYGCIVEVRPVTECCAVMQRMQDLQEAATA